MLRRLFTAASVVSLVLLAVMIALSIRTHFTTDYLIRASGGRCVLIDTSGTDSLWVAEFDGWPIDEPLHWWHGSERTVGYIFASDQWANRWWVELGPDGRPVQHGQQVETHRSGPMTRQTLYWLRFSNWIALTLPLPLAWGAMRIRRSLRRRRRIADGSCSNCGYDLRASTNLCPECGAPIPVKQN